MTWSQKNDFSSVLFKISFRDYSNNDYFQSASEMDIVFVDFSQEPVWKWDMKNWSIEHNGNRTYWLLDKCQILLNLLDDVNVSVHKKIITEGRAFSKRMPDPRWLSFVNPVHLIAIRAKWSMSQVDLWMTLWLHWDVVKLWGLLFLNWAKIGHEYSVVI